MSEHRIDPEAAQREAKAFATRWAQCLATLAAAKHVRTGPTPAGEIFREDKMVVYRYRPVENLAAEQRVRTPLVICYALVNRPYVLDLQEDRSFVRKLLAQGVDVYLIDWGYADGADRFLGLEDYVCGYLHHAIGAVARHSGRPQVNLLGVCQGGTLSLCYAALYPKLLRNLVTMVTPVDFHTEDNTLMQWARSLDVDALLSASGNVPGELLNSVFVALLPFRLSSEKYVDLLSRIDDPAALENFLRMEQWIFDSPDQPGQLVRDFVTQFVRGNGLVTGAATIAERAIDLQAVRLPLLNIYATQDHLVPASASLPLAELVGSKDYTVVPFSGGHIGLYVSGSAQRAIPRTIADWLRARDA